MHEDPDGRFPIGCIVWSPGQHTPIHDQAGWGVAGVAAGALRETSYRLEQGRPVTLFERTGRVGVGLDHATVSPSHILNVRAANKRAFSDDTAHFER